MKSYQEMLKQRQLLIDVQAYRIAELEAQVKNLVSELAALTTEFWPYMSGNSKDYYKTLLYSYLDVEK
jgi:hypothetical protein